MLRSWELFSPELPEPFMHTSRKTLSTLSCYSQLRSVHSCSMPGTVPGSRYQSWRCWSQPSGAHSLEEVVERASANGCAKDRGKTKEAVMTCVWEKRRIKRSFSEEESLEDRKNYSLASEKSWEGACWLREQRSMKQHAESKKERHSGEHRWSKGRRR